eukprot:2562732-Alexandrium_andersonii.AAC.1
MCSSASAAIAIRMNSVMLGDARFHICMSCNAQLARAWTLHPPSKQASHAARVGSSEQSQQTPCC